MYHVRSLRWSRGEGKEERDISQRGLYFRHQWYCNRPSGNLNLMMISFE